MHKNYNVDFKTGYIIVVETKNGEIRKVPMNKQLTAILKNVKGTGQLSDGSRLGMAGVEVSVIIEWAISSVG